MINTKENPQLKLGASTTHNRPQFYHNPAQNLIERLDKVRKNGPDSWSACCPAHNDKSPSLVVRELADGRVLVHCFAGCGVDEIVRAVGLEMRDLFPPRNITHTKPETRPFPAAAILKAIVFEVIIVKIAGEIMSDGNHLGDEEHKRLVLAVERIQHAEIAGGLHD
jgi:hypothetical protein